MLKQRRWYQRQNSGVGEVAYASEQADNRHSAGGTNRYGVHGIEPILEPAQSAISGDELTNTRGGRWGSGQETKQAAETGS